MSLSDITFKTILTRSSKNPILSKKDIPYPAEQIYNAGVTKFNGKYVMVFRNDYGRTAEDFKRESWPSVNVSMGVAESDNGIDWNVLPDPCAPISGSDILGAYDPRLTVIDGRLYMCFAIDTKHGVQGGIAVTDDLKNFEVLCTTVPDNRNMVLFPEKFGGKFLRLERPFPMYSKGVTEKFDIWMSDSPDCRYWGNPKLLLSCESVPFANTKIGPSAPPVKTSKGWLTTFHAVHTTEHELKAWHSGWHKAYYGGIMLLDLNDPSKIIGMCPSPILSPEEQYETEGMRGSVVFPGGMILEDSGEVKIYYGAADTVECLATANVDELLEACIKHKG